MAEWHVFIQLPMLCEHAGRRSVCGEAGNAWITAAAALCRLLICICSNQPSCSQGNDSANAPDCNSIHPHATGLPSSTVASGPCKPLSNPADIIGENRGKADGGPWHVQRPHIEASEMPAWHGELEIADWTLQTCSDAVSSVKAWLGNFMLHLADNMPCSTPDQTMSAVDPLSSGQHPAQSHGIVQQQQGTQSDNTAAMHIHVQDLLATQICSSPGNQGNCIPDPHQHHLQRQRHGSKQEDGSSANQSNAHRLPPALASSVPSSQLNSSFQQTFESSTLSSSSSSSSIRNPQCRHPLGFGSIHMKQG